MRKALYILGGIILLVVFVVVFFRPDSEDSSETRPISVLLVHMQTGIVDRIVITGDTIDVTLSDGTGYETQKESGASLFTIFADEGIDASGVEIEVKDRDTDIGDWAGLLLNFVPLLIFIGIIYALIRAINRIPRP
jgi:ATP-dependent Zn protease